MNGIVAMRKMATGMPVIVADFFRGMLCVCLMAKIQR
jgi:hypothetical protein